MGVLLKDKLSGVCFDEDWDDWKSNYENRRHESISDLQYYTLATLFSNLEWGIVEMIIDSILDGVAEQDDTDIVFFQEVEYALDHFIIVLSDTKEDEICREKVVEGELHPCGFNGSTTTKRRVYYKI